VGVVGVCAGDVDSADLPCLVLRALVFLGVLGGGLWSLGACLAGFWLPPLAGFGAFLPPCPSLRPVSFLDLVGAMKEV